MVRLNGLEEGLIKKHVAKTDTKFIGQDDIMASSVTPFLLFTTFVAVSASLTFGCAVSFCFFLLCFIHFRWLFFIIIIIILLYIYI